ncbi:unnamed protein product [Calicophoron daubneyi]|uniref:Uncharacterized protein n=1 Tax=Calicophoron daubneyi TaxID=300641 RepID=A0AAV2T288_CALDB
MKVLQARRGVVAGSGLLVRSFRSPANAYSAFQKEKPINFVVVGSASCKSPWPNQRLGPIDAINPKYPLPGAVGVQTTKPDTASFSKNLVPAIHTLPPLKEENYAAVLITTHNATEFSNPRSSLLPQKSDLLECTIHTCPTLIKQDLASLFPDRKFTSEPLTTVVLSHRTTSSPNEWSELAASEREALAETVSGSDLRLNSCSLLGLQSMSVQL